MRAPPWRAKRRNKGIKKRPGKTGGVTSLLISHTFNITSAGDYTFFIEGITNGQIPVNGIVSFKFLVIWSSRETAPMVTPKLVIGNDNQSVHMFLNLLDSSQRIYHTDVILNVSGDITLPDASDAAD